MSNRIRVVVAHPNRQHVHHTVIGLQRANMLRAFLTPFWDKTNQEKSFLKKYFPKFISEKLLAILKKRSYPGIDPEKVHTYSPLKLVFFLMIRIFLSHRNADKTLNSFFDSWVVRKIKSMEFDVLIGYETSSLKASEYFKECGGIFILDHASEHWKFQEKIISEEKKNGYLISDVKSALFDHINEIKEKELELADYVLTPSSYSMNSLVEAGVSENKVIKLPYGVNLSTFTLKKEFRKDEKFVILFVGSIIPRKGVQYVLQSFKELKLKNAKVVLAGNVAGDGQKILNQYRGYYEHIPYLSDHSLVSLYQRADLLVIPSLMDSFGLVVLEAMACGTPAIVSLNTGAKDLIEDGKNGFTVPIRNVDSIKEKMLWCYENPYETFLLGRNARQVAEKNSWEVYYSRLAEIVNNIGKNHHIISDQV